ncbi:MAG: exodeoxyribonuclease V subunit gamma [Clostridia bacterium]|nr:exodeoxyribonuclease V subunit gamma [Clostridia bacterium]
MPSFTIFRGGAHTGKSTALYDRIREHKAAGEHAILLVPEQATYAAEQKLCEKLGGLLGVEVYSFERFSERLLTRFGRVRPFLSVEGRYMVLRRAAYKQRGKLTVFSRVSQTSGFAETMDEWIGRFKQSCITPDDLERALGALEKDSLLYKKLSDILLIYRESESFLESRYLTAQDLLSEALAILPRAGLSDTHVYVDDLDRTREQVMRLLKGIIAHAKSVTMTLRAEAGPELAALFAPEEQRAAALLQFCAERSIPFSERTFDRQSVSVDPALNHLCRGLFAPEPKPFETETAAVTVTGCATQALEADVTADRILKLVREDDSIRYSDIAIVVSSLETYAPLLKRAFRLRDIPLFFDASHPILGHAAADFVLSSVRAAVDSLNVNDLLHVLKSGYAGVGTDETEIFENYLLRYGLFGSSLKDPLTVGEIPDAAERVRAAIVPKLLGLRDALQRKTAGEKVRGVYAYLKETQLRAQLESQADALQKEGEAQDAQTYAQMWNTLMTMFSQIDAIMGDVSMGQKEFCALLEEGLSGYQIGTVPGKKDQVVLGDLVRTRLNRSKVLFLLGCTEGLFPPSRSDDALLNDAELKCMEQTGLTVWGNTALLSAADRLQLYTLLSKATRRICFSYPCAGASGDLVASPLMRTVEALFPKNAKRMILPDSDALPANAAVGFITLSELLRAYRTEGYVGKRLPPLLDYYRSDPAYREATDALLDARAGTRAETQLSKALAKELYGEAPTVSASRLEQFARCPFAQYLKYGLRAEERKEAAERADNVGTFLHDALDLFVKTAKADGRDLRTMTNADADAILNRILPPLIAQHNDGIFERNERQREALIVRIRMIRWCAYSVLRQIREGKFTIAATEASFGMGEGLLPVSLVLSDGTRIGVYGKIDRIDRTEDGTMFRIVDYKTGRAHKFDPTKFRSGETIQLPLYLEAAKQLGGEAVGMYYMPLTADAPESADETPMNPLSGVTADDEAAIAASDMLLEKKSALIGKLTVKKDGGYAGDLATRAQLEALKEQAIRTAANAAERILNGEADVYPTATACTWCPYGAVCRFDRQLGCKYRAVQKTELSDLLQEGGGDK